MSRVVIDAPHRVAGHCGSGSMRDLLEWSGLGYGDEPPSEALTFALSGGLAFQYVRDTAVAPPVYLVGRTGDLELELARRLGIDVEVRRTDDADEGWRFVADEVDAGRPVLINADILELPYLRVQLSNTRHSLLVSGYDLDAGVAYLLDNDRAEPQEVPLDALSRARSADGFPDNPRFATYPMRFPAALPDLAAATRDACAAVVRQLEEGRGLFDAGTLPEPEVDATGLAGVRRFADDLTSWPDVFDADTLAAARFALWVFIEKAGTGAGMFRRLQAEGLREAGERTGVVAFTAAGDAWGTAAAAWSRLGAAVRESIEAAITSADELPALEARAVEATRVAAG